MQHVIIVFPGQWRLIRDMLKETQSLDVIAKQNLYCKSLRHSKQHLETKNVAFCEGLCPNLTGFHRNGQLKSWLYSLITASIFFSFFNPILKRNATQNCNKTFWLIFPVFANQSWFYHDLKKNILQFVKIFQLLANASCKSQKLFLQIHSKLKILQTIRIVSLNSGNYATKYVLLKMVVSSCFNFRSVKLHISRIRMTRLQTLDNFREKSIGRRGVVVSSLSVQNRSRKFNPKQG